MEQLVYEFKAFIFAIAGILSAILLNHPVKWVSVLFFMFASLLILELRYEHRVIRKHRQRLKYGKIK